MTLGEAITGFRNKCKDDPMVLGYNDDNSIRWVPIISMTGFEDGAWTGKQVVEILVGKGSEIYTESILVDNFIESYTGLLNTGFMTGITESDKNVTIREDRSGLVEYTDDDDWDDDDDD